VKTNRIVLFLCLAGPVALSFFLPLPRTRGNAPEADTGLYGIPCCLFHETTGIPCPFCGLTRSFVSVSHGRFADAFLYNFVGPPLYAGFLLGALAQFLPRQRRDPTQPVRRPGKRESRIGLAVAAAFLLAWAAKLLFVPRAWW
jgi:hypothetical protein